MPYLTDAAAREFLAAPTGNFLWDEDAPGRPDSAVPGFGLRKTKAWVYRYRTCDDATQRQMRIGPFPKVKAETARRRAQTIADEVARGNDPQAKKTARRRAATVDQLVERFEAEHLSQRRETTRKDYGGLLRREIIPALTGMKVDNVTQDDIEAITKKLTAEGHLHQSNRAAAVCSILFKLALRWQMRTDGKNPAAHLPHHREEPRARYLDGEEIAGLINVLADFPEVASANVVRLLLLTGARRSEVMGMKWRDIDLQNGVWNRRAADLKGGRDHSVPLAGAAQQLLAQIASEQTEVGQRPLPEFVFPSTSKTRHLVEIKNSWLRIRKLAGLEGVRLHDLRHTHASLAISSGASLEMVAKLLGHRKLVSSARYAHLHLSPQRRVVDTIGATIEAIAKPAATAPVPFKRRKPRP
jgi:integrase